MGLGKIIDTTGRLTKNTLIKSMRLVGGIGSLAYKTGSLATRGLSYGMEKGTEFYEAKEGAKQYDELVTEASRISEHSGVKINPQELANYMATEAFREAYNQETARQETIKESINNFYQQRTTPQEDPAETINLHRTQDGTWSN